jgi:hypothetical protein
LLQIPIWNGLIEFHFLPSHRGVRVSAQNALNL